MIGDVLGVVLCQSFDSSSLTVDSQRNLRVLICCVDFFACGRGN